MKFAPRSRRIVTVFRALALSLSFGLPVAAQDIAAPHLAAARSVLTALNATEQFDGILPSAAQVLKNELIQKNPDLQEAIIEVVDQTAFSLASRRGDLEREAATIYARTFSEAELNDIAAFYNSAAGKKLLSQGANVSVEVMRAADIWQRGIARDLAQQSGEELGKRAPASQPQPSEGGSEE